MAAEFCLQSFHACRVKDENTQHYNNNSVVYFHLYVLCGCETWFLTLRKEHKLRVFENRLLRRIFGPQTDEVIGGWRMVYNE
jgi:hypothetical protein